MREGTGEDVDDVAAGDGNISPSLPSMLADRWACKNCRMSMADCADPHMLGVCCPACSHPNKPSHFGPFGDWFTRPTRHVEAERPHVVRAVIADEFGEITWTVECPYDGQGPRSCVLFDEADCQGECPLERIGMGGNTAFGHGHAIDGCGVQEYVSQGLEDGFGWKGVPFTITDPLLVTCEWVEGLVLLTPNPVSATEEEFEVEL